MDVDVISWDFYTTLYIISRGCRDKETNFLQSLDKVLSPSALNVKTFNHLTTWKTRPTLL